MLNGKTIIAIHELQNNTNHYVITNIYSAMSLFILQLTKTYNDEHFLII